MFRKDSEGQKYNFFRFYGTFTKIQIGFQFLYYVRKCKTKNAKVQKHQMIFEKYHAGLYKNSKTKIFIQVQYFPNYFRKNVKLLLF